MTSASTLAPPKTEPHQLAVSLCAAGKFAEALALLQPVLDARESVAEHLLVETLNVAAVSALGLNRWEDAENYWRQSIAVKPDFVDAYNNLGILLKGLNRLLEAEAMFRSVAAIRPDQAQAYNNLGAVLYGLKRLHDAEAAYRQAIAPITPRLITTWVSCYTITAVCTRLRGLTGNRWPCGPSAPRRITIWAMCSESSTVFTRRSRPTGRH
jgi:tetratricopeptide (TPR) repeat protein